MLPARAVDAAKSAEGRSPTTTRCTHCNLPVPAGLVVPDATEQFCCSGCRTVHETIAACGLDRFYALRERTDARRGGATGRGYEAFDLPAFQDLYVTRDERGLPAIELLVENVHCAACLWLIERLPRVLPGVLEARLDYRRRLVRLRWDPDRTTLARAAAALDALGYPPHPWRGARLEAIRRRESRGHLLRLGVAGAIAGNVMLIAFALWGGSASGMEAGTQQFFRAVALGLTLLALAWPGRVFFTGAWAALRARMLHMDVPVALALAAGTLLGAVNVWRNAGDVYFESLAAVVFLLLVGRWLQHGQQRRAADAVELLYGLAPATARRLDAEGVVEEVPVEMLATGDRIEIRAGESAPADGRIDAGATAFDRSILTGESRPVAAGPGDAVHAGTVNLRAAVTVAIEATGAETRVGRLMAVVERLAAERAPIVRLADRVARRFVVVVLLAAAATATGWWIAAGPEPAIENAIALLIVTCPCALGLATPLALQAAIGRAARAGILVKGGAALESLAKPGLLLLLDKTGTMTEGRARVVAWHGDASVAPMVAALERDVAHPIADALSRDADEAPIAERIEHAAGAGVRGRVGGRSIAVGAIAFIEAETGAALPEALRRAAERAATSGRTPIAVAADGRAVALAEIGDALLPDAAKALDALRAMGHEPRLLSGDDPRTVRAIAAELGLAAAAAEGAASPERKAEIVRREREAGRSVVMVGDGVNDAAALAAATVGIAAHGGAEASLEAADLFLVRPGAERIAEAVVGARRAVGAIRRNLVVSLLYNLVTGGLAIGGAISPLIAAVLMPISSLTVVTLSFRARTFDPADGFGEFDDDGGGKDGDARDGEERGSMRRAAGEVAR